MSHMTVVTIGTYILVICDIPSCSNCSPSAHHDADSEHLSAMKNNENKIDEYYY